MNKIPVTVLSGYLGAGKTTVLNELLNNEKNLKIALIVNDMSEINIDAELIEKGGNLARTEEKLVELSNGCICCTLREDLLIEVKKLVEKGDIDYLVIESTGIGEPIPVAQTFSYIDEELGIDLSAICRLDTMVTVVDANRFWDDYQSGETLLDRKEAVSDIDERNIADLLIDQIEFCDVLILNKVDLVDEEKLAELEKVLRVLQPEAKFIRTNHGKVNPVEIINTNLFDFERVANSAGWLKELTLGHENHTPETEEYGIGSFTYVRRLPFHPMRFIEWTENMPKEIVRAKGIVWSAAHDEVALIFSQAGSAVTVNPVSYWVAALPKAQQEQILYNNPLVIEEWDPEYGDRMTKLVFIGINLPKHDIIAQLDKCLLSTEEMNSDWQTLLNPFPW